MGSCQLACKIALCDGGTFISLSLTPPHLILWKRVGFASIYKIISWPISLFFDLFFELIVNI